MAAPDPEDAETNSGRVHSLQDIQDTARARQERLGFSFSELRKHAHDEEWLDAHPMARGEILRMKEMIGNISKGRISFSGPLLDASEKAKEEGAIREDVSPWPSLTDIHPDASAVLRNIAIPPNPTFETNEILGKQIEVLQALVLTQDQQLSNQEAEVAANADRSKSQGHFNWALIVIGALTLIATIVGAIIAALS